MKIYIVADRMDGLGSRIFNILNAFYLAHILGKRVNGVKIVWQYNKEQWQKNFKTNMFENSSQQNYKVLGFSILPAEETFSKNFCDKYIEKNYNWDLRFDLNKFRGQKINSVYTFLQSNISYKYLVTELYSIDEIFSDIEINKHRIRTIFNNLELLEPFKKAIKLAEQFAFNFKDFICIHIRSGDAIYDYSDVRENNYFGIWHPTPIELACGVINRNPNKKIILVGDDISSLNKLAEYAQKNINKNVFCIEYFKQDLGFNTTEHFFFDIVFMSYAKELFGTYSALVRIAALLNPKLESKTNLGITNTYDYFSNKERLEVYNKYHGVIDGLHPCQKAFSLFHIFMLARELGSDQNYLLNLLEKALAYDFQNNKYRILIIDILLQQNKIKEAEKKLCSYINMKINRTFIEVLIKYDPYSNFYYFAHMFDVFPKFSNKNTPYISFVSANIHLEQKEYFKALNCIKMSLKHEKDNAKFKILHENILQLVLENFNEEFEKYQSKESFQTQINDLNSKLQHSNQEKEQLATQIHSLSHQKQIQELENLKFDTNIKKLQIKKLEKELGLKLSELEPKLIITQDELNSAKARVHKHLAYKLGQALIINSKSFLGYLRMPFILSYIKTQHHFELKKYQNAIAKNPNLKLPPLENYADYKEALQEKQCLTYKLGLALMEADKTWYKGGYVKFYFESKRLKKEFKGKG